MVPIRQKIRRVPYAKLEEFKKIIQDQLDAGIIEPSDYKNSTMHSLKTLTRSRMESIHAANKFKILMDTIKS